ncbi:TrbG/VirB9 family P-type conjugative transfer protein [Oryzomicrobium sp.]|uniref:TrbG/VirB9 family P-type conjugative transfer protein n=1 Tax=Oryzomicrobium sp. TaxID=1911578 RepID=UPI002FE147E6
MMPKQMLVFSLLVGMGSAVSAMAFPLDENQREVKSRFDPRVRIVEYNPLAVVSLKQALGYSIDIQFESDERVVSVFTGDSLAWEIAPRDNHLGIKPREPEGRTNISVITNKRPYQFLVDVLPKEKLPDQDMVFFMVFNYPENPGIKATAQKKDATAKEIRAALKSTTPVRNSRYEACRRNSEINPIAVWDDGRFTYMKFRPGQALPVVDTVLPDGQEAMVNFRMGGQEGDGEADSRTMIVMETATKFITRFGKAESCVINKGTDTAPINDDVDGSGSTRHGFLRIFKGEK